LYGDLVRVAVAVPGNDFRLGMNEAPPAIISIYVGDQLEQVIEDIVGEGETGGKLQRMPSKMQLGVNSLPSLPRDSSDRNRTSPFAFTGNKFEFRAVGSSQSCARPGMILNTVMAESMNFVSDELEKLLKSGMKLDLAVHAVVSKLLKEHHRVVFNGNGYSDEWRKEAEKRGLPNLRTTPEAIAVLSAAKNVEIFEKTGVLNKRELMSTQTIMYENFSKTVAIEAECTVTMAQTYILPVALEHKRNVAAAIDNTDAVQSKLLKDCNKWITDLINNIETLKAAKEQAKKFHEEHLHEQAMYYRKEVMDAMAAVRTVCDTLETVVDDKLWPFSKYSEILFLK